MATLQGLVLSFAILRNLQYILFITNYFLLEPKMKNTPNDFDQNYILVLKKGDEILDSLTTFLNDQRIISAWITGIGAVKEVELALYDLGNKQYHHKKIAGPLELINLNGNAGMFNKKIALHLHATLSDRNMSAFGGHLLYAKIAATCEIMISVLTTPIVRKHNKNIGLNLING